MAKGRRNAILNMEIWDYLPTETLKPGVCQNRQTNILPDSSFTSRDRCCTCSFPTIEVESLFEATSTATRSPKRRFPPSSSPQNHMVPMHLPFFTCA